MIEVRVNDELVDLADSQEPPRIFRRAFDPNQLASPAGDYAITLKLPKTVRNLGILGNVDDVQQAAAFARLGNLDVRIAVDGIEVIRGTLVINRIESQIQCGIVGRNIGWAGTFRDKTLRDIQSLPCLDYSGTAAQGDGLTLWDVWNSDESDGYGIQFPLVSYGNFPADPTNTNTNPLNSVTTVAASAGLIDGALLDNRDAWPLSSLELRPAGYVREILRAMFRDAGYSVEGDFFSSDEFKDWLLPFVDSADAGPEWNFARLTSGTRIYASPTGLSTGSNFHLYESGAINTGFREMPVGQSLLGPPTNPNSPPSTFLQIRGIDSLPRGFPYFIAPADGTYRVKFEREFTTVNVVGGGGFTNNRYVVYLIKHANGVLLNFPRNATPTNSENDWDLPFRAYVTGGALVTPPEVLDVFTSTFFTVGTQTASLDSGCVFLEEGETISAFMIMSHANDARIWAVTSGTTCSMQQSAATECDPTCLSVARVLPDMQQTDFLSYVVRLFNLYIETTENRVGVWTRARYFLPQQAAVPIEGNVDEITPPLLSKLTQFTFANEEGEALFPLGTYDLDYTADSEQLTGSEQVEVGFAPTALRTYYLLTQQTSLDLPTLNTRDELLKPLGELGSGDQEVRLSYTPRILRWKGLAQVTVSDGLYVDNRKYRVDYPTDSGNFVYPRAIQLDNALEWLLTFGTEPSLFTRFYARELRERERGLTVRALARLDAAKVSQLTLRVPVTLNGQVYRLLEIEGFDPTGTKLTKLKLTKF